MANFRELAKSITIARHESDSRVIEHESKSGYLPEMAIFLEDNWYKLEKAKQDRDLKAFAYRLVVFSSNLLGMLNEVVSEYSSTYPEGTLIDSVEVDVRSEGAEITTSKFGEVKVSLREGMQDEDVLDIETKKGNEHAQFYIRFNPDNTVHDVEITYELDDEKLNKDIKYNIKIHRDLVASFERTEMVIDPDHSGLGPEFTETIDTSSLVHETLRKKKL